MSVLYSVISECLFHYSLGPRLLRVVMWAATWKMYNWEAHQSLEKEKSSTHRRVNIKICNVFTILWSLFESAVKQLGPTDLS